MGFLDEIKKLTQPFDDDEDEFFDDDDAQTPIPVSGDGSESARPSAPPSGRKSSFFSDDGATPAPRPVFTPKRDGRSTDAKVVNINASTQLKVVLVKPERFESAAEIADHLRDKRTVVMNLEKTGKDVSRRLIDFLSGVAYAQDGKIRRIANNTYLITPYNVDLMGDLMDELESNGLYYN